MVRSVEGWLSGPASGQRQGRATAAGSAGSSAIASVWAAAVLSATGLACGTNNTYFIQNIIDAPDAGSAAAPATASVGSRDQDDSDGPASAGGDRPPLETPGGGVTPVGLDSSADAGVQLSAGAPTADVSPAALAIDVFGSIGNHYWFEASDEQVEQMNLPYGGGGGILYGDIYAPHTGQGVTFVDHLFVTSAGEGSHTADFGKVQVKLVGQSTGRPWTDQTLPNFKLDADEFVEGNRIGGVKHLRLNNGVVGSIYREKLAYDVYRALGYPAPRTNYAWVSGSVWGAGVDVPYIAVEAYKPQFCKLREAELAGGCVNMWEFYGDVGSGMLGQSDSCQFSECDSARGEQFEDLIASTPMGDGFQAALADWLDWDAFHRFQCLSWILETGDDALHNMNNVLLVERADGKFQLLPYSVDISLNPDWGYYGQLAGSSTLALGCQSDSACWADTIATCEVLVDEFVAIDPVGMLDAINTQLDAQGMLRSGDADRYRSLRDHIEQRIEALPAELESNREAPAYSYCPYPLEQCGYDCVFPGECVICEQPAPPDDPEPVEAADAGVPAEPEPAPGEGGACLPPINLYGAIPL